MTSFSSQTSTKRIAEQFLSGVPISQFDFMDIIDNLSNEATGTANQDELLKLTIQYPLLEKYPLKLQYQQAFLKFIVKKLEIIGAEISSNLYTQYCTLLSNACESDGWRFRIYSLRGLDQPYNHVVLRESDSLISNGTTGLCSWQATEDLVNWCAENSSFFRDRRVLELGSGPGLAGLAVIALCQPKTFCFSDGHPSVLQLLKDNVLLNAGRWSTIPCQYVDKLSDLSSSLKKRSLISCIIDNTSVSVLDLPWESVSTDCLGQEVPFDMVIASDIVFDPSTFASLLSAFTYLIQGGCEVLLVCAERNPETLETFLSLLHSSDLVAVTQTHAATEILRFSNSPPSKIYRIRKASS